MELNCSLYKIKTHPSKFPAYTCLKACLLSVGLFPFQCIYICITIFCRVNPVNLIVLFLKLKKKLAPFDSLLIHFSKASVFSPGTPALQVHTSPASAPAHISVIPPVQRWLSARCQPGRQPCRSAGEKPVHSNVYNKCNQSWTFKMMQSYIFGFGPIYSNF